MASAFGIGGAFEKTQRIALFQRRLRAILPNAPCALSTSTRLILTALFLLAPDVPRSPNFFSWIAPPGLVADLNAPRQQHRITVQIIFGIWLLGRVDVF